MKMNTPAPGSSEAREAGCTCPVMDNSYGKGWMGGVVDDEGNIIFAYRVGCPLHMPSREFKQEISEKP